MDKAAARYLERCQYFLIYGMLKEWDGVDMLKEWDGVETMDSKRLRFRRTPRLGRAGELNS